MIVYALLLAAAKADSFLAEMQRVEASRNAAIKSGNMAALRRLYAPSFHGIAAVGARIDRDRLLAVFKRNAGGDFVADSTILSARRVNGLGLVEGRLKLFSGDRSRLISDSYYFHVFRWRDRHWEMIEGAATPVPSQ